MIGYSIHPHKGYCKIENILLPLKYILKYILVCEGFNFKNTFH